MKHSVTFIIAGLAFSLSAAAQNPAEREQDRWKLSDLYASPADFDADVAKVESELADFQQCKGHLGDSAQKSASSLST